MNDKTGIVVFMTMFGPVNTSAFAIASYEMIIFSVKRISNKLEYHQTADVSAICMCKRMSEELL